MALGDTTAGNWAAMGIMMALYWRDARGGAGQVIDLALYEALYRQFEPQIILVDQLNKVQGRADRNSYAPYQDSFRTKDGRYFSYSAITLKSALALLEAMGMAEDARFNSWDECIKHRVEFKKAVGEWMAARTADEIDAAFRACDAPGAPVMNGADLINHPHLLARDMVLTVDDPDLGPVRMQGVVPKFSKSPGKVRHTGQKLGQSNELIYKQLLGVPDDEYAALQKKAVI
jgi:crotonobetainyl-CoA:carnitine CoA-transferase CaiB-like acyl-CoA transferase